MQVYLGDMEFPMAPERILVSRSGRWERIELAETGEVSRYRPPELRLIRFGGLFPESGFGGSVFPQRPEWYAGALSRMAEGREPVRLVVSGGAHPFSMRVTVERFDWRMEAGEDGDIYYELELREYREYGLETAGFPEGSGSSGAGTSAPGAAERAPDTPEIYIVQKGDCLWTIAKRFLGDGSRYREIAEANGIRNPNRIYPGQKLRIFSGKENRR